MPSKICPVNPEVETLSALAGTGNEHFDYKRENLYTEEKILKEKNLHHRLGRRKI